MCSSPTPAAALCPQAALRLDPATDVSTVALDLPCTFFMLNTQRALAVSATTTRFQLEALSFELTGSPPPPPPPLPLS